jgi:hypothetical protein
MDWLSHKHERRGLVCCSRGNEIAWILVGAVVAPRSDRTKKTRVPPDVLDLDLDLDSTTHGLRFLDCLGS